MDARQGQKEFWEEVFQEYCPSCPSTCCSTKKHAIRVRPEAAKGLFIERGSKYYPWADLDGNTVKSWLDGTEARVRTQGGRKIKSGSLIEVPGRFLRLGPEPGDPLGEKLVTVVYSKDKCPFYTRSGMCRVHEDSRRPYACQNYPLAYPCEQGGEPDYLLLNDLCYLAGPENFRDIESRFHRAFPGSKLELIAHRF
ncbi:MAG: hypothetical protein JW727_05980 [Candidatus Aenigmarchaeota archaeon]|nr:hypothetical protein [Candidatus Aenigmarchaeota archaeon]